MAAPKKPNTVNATAKVVRNAEERKAADLRARGWFIASPDEIATIEAEEWGPGQIAEWYMQKTDQLNTTERRPAGGRPGSQPC